MSTSLPSFRRYQYTSLKPVHSTFRILKLLKQRGPELECELSQHSLLNGRHTPYEALSYVWGSDERVECITLDQKRFWVTDNLYSALQCLRLRDRDRHLWIDAICINQTDKEEQSRQVQQMGAIFKLAEQVVFWLGKATPEIITLIDALNQSRVASADCDLGQLTLDNNRWEHCRTGLRQLLNRQWFTRVWILQEAAHAQKATVCCSTLSVPAEVFARAPSLIGEEPKQHCQAILDIMPGTSRSGSWWSQKRDLCTLLHRFQSSKATDERDKIYALLGMSTNPPDIQNIDIDYQTPVHEVLQKVITYLLQSTPAPIHEMLNLMNNFATLDTIYFVPTVKEGEATEVLFPHLQSGKKLDGTENLEYGSQSIAVVNIPSLFLFERRLESDLSEQETCHSQVVKLMMGVQTIKMFEYEAYDDGLRVIPWGSIEQHVKIVVIHDEKNAILKAAVQGYGQLVRMLLDMEVGGEAREELEDSALYEAIAHNHTQAIHTILNQSTDVHVRHGRYKNALWMAAYQGAATIVELLLEYGADVNGQEETSSALHAASLTGNRALVKTLLKHGAEVNTQGGYHGCALQAAAYQGTETIVELLLKHGAEINTENGEFGNALQAASFRGNGAVVKMLLDHGAKVNAKGGQYGNALQAASYSGHKAVVEMLLKEGAKVNAQGGFYGDALQAASHRDHKAVVEILLHAGAELNAQSRTYVNALKAA